MSAPANRIAPESEEITPEMLPLFALQGRWSAVPEPQQRTSVGSWTQVDPAASSQHTRTSTRWRSLAGGHSVPPLGWREEREVYITPVLERHVVLRTDVRAKLCGFLSSRCDRLIGTVSDVLRTSGSLWEGLSQADAGGVSGGGRGADRRWSPRRCSTWWSERTADPSSSHRCAPGARLLSVQVARCAGGRSSPYGWSSSIIT